MPEDRKQAEGPVVICYDGSDQAAAGIAAAGRLLRPSTAAIVVTVWEPYSALGFGSVPVPRGPVPQETFDTIDGELKAQAEQVADEGAELAREAGFDAEPFACEGVPAWERIVKLADERDSSLIVLGSHGRTGLTYVVMGSVATAVSQHARRSVLIVTGPEHEQ